MPTREEKEVTLLAGRIREFIRDRLQANLPVCVYGTFNGVSPIDCPRTFNGTQSSTCDLCLIKVQRKPVMN